MSLNEYIQMCSCGGGILRTRQQKKNGGNDRCDNCEIKHAKTLKERLEAVEQEREFNG